MSSKLTHKQGCPLSDFGPLTGSQVCACPPEWPQHEDDIERRALDACVLKGLERVGVRFVLAHIERAYWRGVPVRVSGAEWRARLRFG